MKVIVIVKDEITRYPDSYSGTNTYENENEFVAVAETINTCVDYMKNILKSGEYDFYSNALSVQTVYTTSSYRFLEVDTSKPNATETDITREVIESIKKEIKDRDKWNLD